MIRKTFEHEPVTIKNEIGGKFKNVKGFEFYVLGGVLFLAAFFLLVAWIGQGSAEFDSRVEIEIERIHSQISAEKYADVYSQAGRTLITRFDQPEFENLLRAARPQLAGTVKKSCTTFYPDMVERLKRNLFMSFQLETICRIENESLKSYQYFDWRLTGEETKLIWFGTEPRKH